MRSGQDAELGGSPLGVRTVGLGDKCFSFLWVRPCASGSAVPIRPVPWEKQTLEWDTGSSPNSATGQSPRSLALRVRICKVTVSSAPSQTCGGSASSCLRPLLLRTEIVFNFSLI